MDVKIFTLIHFLYMLCDLCVADQLIDLTDFTFVRKTDICGSDPVDILFIISSAPDHLDFREAQRDTWANVTKYSAKYRFKIAFMIGLLSEEDEELEKKIEQEAEQYSDIVIGNTIDSYHNLTYKHIMGLKWASEMCPQARYVIKADDDVYVDIFRLWEVVGGRFGWSGGGGGNLLVCAHLFTNNKPYRDDTNKYYVSYEEYPSDAAYPEFCSGAAILYSPDVARRVVAESARVRYLRLEDVYATSIIRRRLGIKPLAFDQHMEWNPNAVKKFINDKKVKRGNFIFALAKTPSELYALWNKLLAWFEEVKKVRTNKQKT